MNTSDVMNVADAFRTATVLTAVRSDLNALRAADPTLESAVNSALEFVETFRMTALTPSVRRMLPAYLRLVGSTSDAADALRTLNTERGSYETRRAQYTRRMTDVRVSPESKARAAARLAALTPVDPETVHRASAAVAEFTRDVDAAVATRG